MSIGPLQAFRGLGIDPGFHRIRSLIRPNLDPPDWTIESPGTKLFERVRIHGFIVCGNLILLSGVFPMLCLGVISPGNRGNRLSVSLHFREDAFLQFCV